MFLCWGRISTADSSFPPCSPPTLPQRTREGWGTRDLFVIRIALYADECARYSTKCLRWDDNLTMVLWALPSPTLPQRARKGWGTWYFGGSGFALAVAGGCGDLLRVTSTVTWVVTLLNLCATSMARLGVALVVWACYFDDIEASP